MKVNLLQVGGILPTHTPWQYPSAPAVGSSTSSGTSKSSKSSGDTDEYIDLLNDVLKKLNGEALSSEYGLFAKSVSRFIHNPSQKAVMGLLEHANLLMNNKKRSNEVSQILKELKVEGEIARSGQLVYCQDMNTGKVERLSVADVKKRIKKKKPVRLLTNTQLDTLRRDDPNLGYHNEIFDDLTSAVSTEAITAYCMTVIDKIEKEGINKSGVTTKADVRRVLNQMSAQFQGKQPTEEQLQGFVELSQLYGQMGEDGTYKYTINNASKRQSIQKAFDYIYSLMPKNMKDALVVKAALNDHDKPHTYIAELLEITTENVPEIKAELDETSMSNKGRMSEVETFIDGSLNQTEIPISLDSNTVVNFKGSVIGALFDKKQNPIDTTLLNNVLSNQNMGTFVDKNQVYFGTTKIPTYQQQNFVYTGDKAMLTEVPVKTNGDIDFDMFLKLSKAKEQIKNAPNPTPEVIQTIYKKNGVPTKIVNNQVVPNLQVERFFVTNGITTDDVIDLDELSNPMFIQQVNNDDTAEGYEAILDNIYTTTNAILAKNGLSEIDQPGGNPLEGVIFMKMSSTTPTSIAASSGHGSVVSVPTLGENMVRQSVQNSRNNNNFTAAGFSALQ